MAVTSIRLALPSVLTKLIEVTEKAHQNNVSTIKDVLKYGSDINKVGNTECSYKVY